MKFAMQQAVLGLSLIAAAPVFATTQVPATMTLAPTPAHVKAVQDLLGAMEVEKVLRGVAARSRYPTEAQRKSVFAKLDKTPPATPNVIFGPLTHEEWKAINLRHAELHLGFVHPS